MYLALKIKDNVFFDQFFNFHEITAKKTRYYE